MLLLFSLAIILFSQLQLSRAALQQPLTKPGQQHSLHKRGEGTFSGRATYYDPGLGACGQTNGPNDFIVALNKAQYNANKWCNKKIKIFFGGNSTTATIVDECPGCPPNALDLSPSLFEYFSAKDAGIFYMSWSLLDDLPHDKPAPAPKPAPPPPKIEYQPPPKPEEQQPPPAKDPPPKKQIEIIQPPDHSPKKDDPPTSTTTTPNPFSVFQPSPALTPVSRPNPTATRSSSVAATVTSSNQGALQLSIQTDAYAPGGNLDAINLLVISFGSLAAVSANSALNIQS